MDVNTRILAAVAEVDMAVIALRRVAVIAGLLLAGAALLLGVTWIVWREMRQREREARLAARTPRSGWLCGRVAATRPQGVGQPKEEEWE